MGCPRRLILLAALLAITAACTGGEPPPPDPEPEPALPDVPEPEPADIGGTLRVGLAAEPASIDPRFVVDAEGELVVAALFEPLVTLDEELEVAPAAAYRWTADDDGRELTFHLRAASFHDGTPVTADDFVRTFTRIADGAADPPSFLAYLLASVEGIQDAQEGGELTGVEARDESTLVIRLTQPDPGFLRLLSNPSLVPTPPSADDVEEYGARPIGNGPFMLAEARDPEAPFLRLTRFEGHRSPAQLDEVLFQIYPEDASGDRQWQDLLDGQLQVAEVPPERYGEAEQRFGRSPDGYRGPGLITGITSTVYLYAFDTTREPFDDPRVRQAISLAIDRDRLADVVMQGTRAPATGLIPPAIPGSQTRACDHCRHDPAAARELLEEAEVELERLTLTHNRGRTHAAIAESMALDLEQALRIDVDLQAMDLRPFIQSVRRGDVALFRLGWEVGEPDAGAYLWPLFHSSQVGLDNLSRFADEELDELLEEARAAPDAVTATSRYREAERRILAEAPVVPLMWYRHSHVVAPQVQDLVLDPFGRIDFGQVRLEPGE